MGALALDSEPNAFFYPLYWEQGLSERLTFVWSPLPLQARYLIHADESQWMTAELSFFGSIYSRDKDFNWRPSLQANWRLGLGSDVALDAEILFQADIKRSPVAFARTLGVRAGAFLQIARSLWLKPSAWVFHEEGATFMRYLGAVPPSVRGSEAGIGRWRFPFELDLGVSVHRQWEILLNVQLYALGYEAGYYGIPAYLSVVHYW